MSVRALVKKVLERIKNPRQRNPTEHKTCREIVLYCMVIQSMVYKNFCGSGHVKYNGE